jgi:hypothetical protein
MSEVPTENSGAVKAKRSCLLMLIVLTVVLSAPVFLLYMGCFSIGPFGLVNQADAGFRRAKKNIDPEQLRAWAFAINKAHSATNDSGKVKISEVPDYIKNLYSQEPEFVSAHPNEGMVLIAWGGGFFSWNFIIGQTNWIETPSEELQVAEWVPGIYYTREGNQKIK